MATLPGTQVFALMPNADTASKRRKPHTKSRNGCYSCKQRHQKCDEKSPSCSRCQRLGKACHRPDIALSHPRFREFKITLVAHVKYAGMSTPEDTSAFEYFHTIALPILRLTPSFDLWNQPMGFLSQTSSAIRKIIVALGSQQRFLQERDSSTERSRIEERADRCYTNAVRALRLSITTEDRLTIAFGCTLLSILASLRGSQEELFIHLRSGMRLISEKTARHDKSTEMRDIAYLLHESCTTSWLFGFSPAYSGDWCPLATDIAISLAPRIDLHAPSDLWFELTGIIRETVCTFRTIVETPTPKSELVYSVYRLRSRNMKVQQALDDQAAQGRTEAARFKILRASLKLSKLFLDLALGSTEPRSQDITSAFQEIVDLVASFLEEARSTVAQRLGQPCTFSTGMQTLCILDSVITRCPDMMIRRKALELADLCPSREGAWVAHDAKKAWSRLIQAENEGSRRRQSPEHVFPADERDKPPAPPQHERFSPFRELAVALTQYDEYP